MTEDNNASSGWECHDCLGTGISVDNICPYCEGWGWYNADGSPRREVHNG